MKRKKIIVKITKTDYIIACLSFALGIGLGYIPIVCFFSWLIPLAFSIFYRKNSFIYSWSIQSTIISVIFATLYLFIYVLNIFIEPSCVYGNIGFTCNGSFVGWKILDCINLLVCFVSSVVAVIAILKINEKKQWKIPIINKIVRLITKEEKKVKSKKKTANSKTTNIKVKGKKKHE